MVRHLVKKQPFRSTILIFLVHCIPPTAGCRDARVGTPCLEQVFSADRLVCRLLTACLTQRNYLKIVYPIKRSDFFLYRLLRWNFSGKKNLKSSYSKLSHRIVTSTIALYRCFLDARSSQA